MSVPDRNTPTRRWQDITPANAVALDLSVATHITAPVNEQGERCPWPWEPQQLVGAPIGQYHCPWCLAMVIAGVEHLDYRCAARPPCPHPITEHDPVPTARDGLEWACAAPGCRCGHSFRSGTPS